MSASKSISVRYNERSASTDVFAQCALQQGGYETYETLPQVDEYWLPIRIGQLSEPKMVPSLSEWRRGPARTRRSQWNSFEHYKCERDTTVRTYRMPRIYGTTEPLGVWPQGPFKVTIGGLPYPQGPWALFGSPEEFYLRGLPPMTSRDPESGEFILPPDPLTHEYVSASLRKMLPSVRGELSLINSLLELKDLLTLKKSLTKLKDLLLNRLGSGRITRFNIRRLLAVGSDGYLQWKFNIAPFISDCKGIFQTIKESGTSVQKLLDSEGRMVTKHYYRNASDDQSLIEFDTPGFYDFALYGQTGNSLGDPITVTFPRSVSNVCRLTATQPASFHAQIRYTYRYNKFQREYARSLAFLDSLGVCFDPTIVWNAIPWSFVADWFVGVQRFLSQNTRVGNMDPEVYIDRYMYSWRKKRTVQVRYTLNYLGPIPANETVVLPEVVETSYQRLSITPDSSLLTTSGLSLTEFSLGAALVLSRERRRHRRRGPSRPRSGLRKKE